MTKNPFFEANLFGETHAAESKPAPPLPRRAGRKSAARAGKAAAKADNIAADETAALVSVLVPVPQAGPYSYAVPAAFMPREAPAKTAAAAGNIGSAPLSLPAGTVVRVPLGRRLVAGVIADRAPQKPAAGRLRFVDKIFDCPPLSSELMQFIRFFADYTMTPIGMAARMVLAAPAALEPLPGLPALRWTGAMPAKLTEARRRVLALLPEQPIWTRSGLAHAAGVSAAVIDTLAEQGVFARAHLPPEPVVPAPEADYAAPVLTQKQAEAAEALRRAVRRQQFGVSLLEGVTGSGKTEVYFEAVAEALRQKRQVLVLLPEIALTRQVLARFEKRFGVPPAEWHSGLGPKKREMTWRQIAEGRVRIVAGARSALFLPFTELGLIIVDEEHDPAYKQEERIFYNARDMAVARGRSANIAVILSSATPAVETCVNVLQGRYRHVILPSRFGAGVLPHIGIVDMRQTPPEKGSFLSAPVKAAMAQTLQKNEQSLLFLNRRGYAPLTLCRICGHRFSCPDCTAWLVEHRRQGQLVCHYCGFHRPVPEACPECGTLDHLVPVGPGVERIAEEVKRLFPQARALVLSADTGRTIEHRRAELEAVVSGAVDIIIGTQLVAKGHHFPKMTFVGVVDADIGLNKGDLRAAERSFQLLSQVTGRAGRAIAQSCGLIQTWQPQHPVIKALAAGDGQAFIRREIEERALYSLPPFGQMAAIIVSAENREAAEHYARLLRRKAPESAAIMLLGPAEAPLARRQKRWRFRLLVQADSRSVHIQAFVRAALAAAGPVSAAVRVQVDIDPQSFL
ncbi:MAG: primosomal protein N' [Candidatus Tokpelaia sp.]|nr:MAG: primosomal protein N' [Candidatus Tokpelaia sp.]KAA6207255.1 MAG: primosomal protein N' [Candidatus Tokpelaia sp.]